MAFDPSVISSIPDNAGNPVHAVEEGVQLKDMLDQEKLTKLQTGAEERTAKENAAADAVLKGSDYSTPQGLAATVAKLNQVSPSKAMDLMKFGQSYQSGQVKLQIDSLNLANQRQGLIVNAIDPIVAQARQMRNNGASDLDVRAYITSQMPGALKQLRSQTLPDGKPALPDDQLKMAVNAPGGYTLATLESWEGRSKQGQAAIQSRIKQLTADTGAAGEREKVRHDEAIEKALGNKAAMQNFTPGEQDLLGALADLHVSLPAGMRSQADIKAEIAGLIKRHPQMSADQIAAGLQSGTLKFTAESKAASVAGTQIGKVALAANELDTFGQQTLAASQALPRGGFVPWNKLRNYTRAQLSDPKLLAFKSKMQALENAYDQLAARGGTDVDKRDRVHQLFNTANSPEAVQTLVQALNQEAAGARQAADRTIAETSGSAIPGTGGAGAPPVPGGATVTPPAAAGAGLPPGFVVDK